MRHKKYQGWLLCLASLGLISFAHAVSPLREVAANNSHMMNHMSNRSSQNESEASTDEALQSVNPLQLPPLLESDSETPEEISYTIISQTGETNFKEGQATETMGYNGSYLGPIMKFRKGQRVTINLDNQLAEETTYHWHGLIVPADVDGGPHHPLASKSQTSISFDVNQEAATLWFHAHPHGKTARQVYNGLAGMIYIEDENSDSLDLPKEYGINDFPVILQERYFDENNQFNYDEVMNLDGTKGDTPLVNGTIQPYIEVNAEWIRLRLVNGSNGKNYELALSDGAEFYQIASDGGFLDAPVAMESLTISPGERAEILVDAQAYAQGEEIFLMDKKKAMLGIRVSGEAAAEVKALPESLNQLPATGQVANPDVRTISMEGIGHMVTLNGRKFDMDYIDFSVKQGSTEIWEVTNNVDMMPGMIHPFHVHGVQFRVLDRDGNPPPANEEGWKDTILVKPGETVRIEISFPVPGLFMLHCHILEHEESGMMGQFMVE